MTRVKTADQREAERTRRRMRRLRMDKDKSARRKAVR